MAQGPVKKTKAPKKAKLPPKRVAAKKAKTAVGEGVGDHRGELHAALDA